MDDVKSSWPQLAQRRDSWVKEHILASAGGVSLSGC